MMLAFYIRVLLKEKDLIFLFNTCTIYFQILFTTNSFKLIFINVSFLKIFFQFVVELLIVKNYGAAVIFITPLTVIMAEITSANMSTEVLLHHRLVDISIGSTIGIIGGTVFHRTSLLKNIESRMNARSSLSGRKPS